MPAINRTLNGQLHPIFHPLIYRNPMFLLRFVFCFTLLISSVSQPVYAQDSTETKPSIRIAIGDIPGFDMLILEAAAARAAERNVHVTISYLQSEDLATQAIINGLADVGMGTPYALIHNTRAPIRLFYQLNSLRFFPVVDTQYYNDWEDLDGAPMYTHGEGSGTEAIMMLMARKHDIQYSAMHYVPGSGVRAKAMIKGRIHATIVDTERRNKLLSHVSGRFKILPTPTISASDEALYGHLDFLHAKRAEISILIEELIQVSRMINGNPNAVVELRDKYNILRHSTDNKESALIQMYEELVSVDAIPNNGGYPTASAADLKFFAASGTLNGNSEQLTADDFWEFSPLTKALERTGIQ